MKSYSLAHMSRHTPRRLSESHAKRGQAVRRLIIDYIATCPHPPSLREIGEAVGLSSSSTVWSHVRTLREEGRIAPAKLGQPRAILLADPGPSEVEILRERVAELEAVLRQAGPSITIGAVGRCNDCELEVKDGPEGCQCCHRCHKEGFPCRSCGNTGESGWDGHRRCPRCHRVLKEPGACWTCYDQEGQPV